MIRSAFLLPGVLICCQLWASPFKNVDLQEPEELSLPHLQITLKPDDLNRLTERRNAVLEEHVLETSGDDFVPALFAIDGKPLPGEIRLKGDFVVHLQGFKWSYRVKLKGDRTLLGMKTFSLHHPRIRLFLHEYVVLEALRQEGLIALRYLFVKVSINGTYLGIYNLEEHFESKLLSHNRRSDGPILKIDETMLFQLINRDLSRTNKDGILFTESPISTFQKEKTRSDPVLSRQFEKATQLLDAFRKNRAGPADVFDLDEFARYFAITDVFMGKHGARWHNQRFYFNPLLSRLQPIGFDFNDDKPGLDSLSRINRDHGLFYGTNWAFDVMSRMLFSEDRFFLSYMDHVQRISHPRYLHRFFESIGPQLSEWETALAMEFANTRYEAYFRFNDSFRQAYRANQAYVRRAVRARQPVLLHTTARTPEQLSVVFENRGEMPLQVTEFRLDNQRIQLKPPIDVGTYRFKHLYSLPRNNVVAHILDLEADGSGPGEFVYRTLGGNIDWVLPVTPLAPGGVPTPGAEPPDIVFDQQHPMRRLPNWRNYSWITERKDSLMVLPGRHVLEDDLIIGPAKKLVIPAGTEVDLKSGSSIVSWAPIDSLGTRQKPVVIHSTDGSGGGIVVLDSKEESRWRHTLISGLRSPSHAEWQPDGTVTFYRSPVAMREVRFSRTRAEDALNLVASDFRLEAISFDETESDALDVDFGTGSISDMTATHSGNDALDISGTVIKLDGFRARYVGDKALSIGEKSRLIGSRISIANSVIGLAVKDQSLTDITDLKVSRTRIGITAYQKKPEYLPSTTLVSDLDITGVDVPFLMESGSIHQISDHDPRLFRTGKKQKFLLRALKNEQPIDN